MNFKYYDLLANLIVGVVAFYALWHFCFPEWEISEWMVLPAGYFVGFFVDALSSLLEPVLFLTIGGKPSNKLLTPRSDRDWTGLSKVRFYFTNKAIEDLKNDTGDMQASPEKMFAFAKRQIDTKMDCRVPDFKSHYSLSRVILTTVIIVFIIVGVKYYNVWYAWVISLAVLFLAWNRFRERGYYYAREVLDEYLKIKS